MSGMLRGTAIALAVLGAVGVAAAADHPLYLTWAQRQAIYQGVMKEKGQPAPSGFHASLGAKVPASLTVHQLPGKVTTQIPAARGYGYAKLADNEVLLVDPKSRQVAELIAPTSTTGSR